jgi:hypothetical protein
MHDCLGRVLGFEQVEVAPGDAAYQEILAQLGAVTHACTAQDTFVFYFAGHSWARDGLQLVIAEDYRERQNWMPAGQIVAFIKDCPALCKLIILDSCEAGKAAEGLLPDPGSNIRVLTATDGVLLAQERTTLAAGVFTFHLGKALTDEALRHAGANGVLDENGNLCLECIHRWLRTQVPGYAKEGEPRIPEPQLYGGTGREIYFATGLTPYLRRPFARDELEALLALLADARLTPVQLDEEYEDVLAKSGLRGGHYREPAPRLAESGLDAAIGFLARAGKMSGVDVAVPVPLLELVARLAHLAETGEALRQWLRDSAENLRDKEFTQANIAALGYTRETPRVGLQARYLLIAFEPIDRNLDNRPPIERYLKLGPLGTAFAVFAQPEKHSCPRVLLIDEIDKSDIDLPNDLLHIFEEGHFDIDELKRDKADRHWLQTEDGEHRVELVNGRVSCATFPFVVMTSNAEREFPPAFLRRCIQLEMHRPDEAKLRRIVKVRLQEEDPEAFRRHADLIDEIVHAFHSAASEKDLVTDQLLNVVLLVMKGIDPFEGIRPLDEHDKDSLIAAL